MASLKVFTLGLNGVHPPQSARALLGLARGQHQVQVLVVAPSKAAAYGLVSAMPGLSVPSRSDPEFRMAVGNDVDALAIGGQFAEPRVLAYQRDHMDVAVVEIRADGRHWVVGRLVRGVRGVGYRFEPAVGA